MTSLAIMTASSAVASLVGKSVLSQAVYDTSTVLLGFARSSVYSDHPELSSILEELDIEATFLVIEELLGEIPHNYEKHKTLHTCIHNVNVTVQKIKEILNNIDIEVEYHKKRYFNYWRKPNYGMDILRLKKTKRILEKRLKLLINVLKITKK